MNRIFKIGMAVILCSAGVSLMYAGGEQEENPVPTPGVERGERFQLQLEPGPYYSEEQTIVFYKYTVQPQVAVWLETEEGTYLETLYVTSAVYDNRYRAAPEEGRPEALPVWSHLQKKGEQVDGVSSATTLEDSISYGRGIASGLKPGRYIVKLETNRSYDWNETYTKKNSGVNGQPSLIYRAELIIGDGQSRKAEFIPVGTGSVDGSEGSVKPGLEGIDTALALFTRMSIQYIPE